MARSSVQRAERCSILAHAGARGKSEVWLPNGGIPLTRKLYRGMKADGKQPLIARSRRALGVVLGDAGDVRPDEAGTVHPGYGMSVAPDDPTNLPLHRRPAELAGTGSDPVWEILEDVLPGRLSFAADTLEHGVVQPAKPMALADYEEALADTSANWTRFT